MGISVSLYQSFWMGEKAVAYCMKLPPLLGGPPVCRKRIQ